MFFRLVESLFVAVQLRAFLVVDSFALMKGTLVVVNLWDNLIGWFLLVVAVDGVGYDDGVGMEGQMMS